uniref:RING-CH-type domain-containing protein n=1 Tax=Strigamia maritima TaxID=126957 RepID=T1IJ85_STRMM
MEASNINSIRMSPPSVHMYKEKNTDSVIKNNKSPALQIRKPTSSERKSSSPRDDSSCGSFSEPQCRICYGGKECGPLINSCRCTGSIAFAHEQCLKKWLQEKGTSKCEICCTTYQQPRTLENIGQWTFPVLMCSPNLFRGLFLTTLIWICVYYFIIIAIQPQNFIMKEVFFAVMYFLLMVLIVMTFNSCQPFTFSVRQWVDFHNQTTVNAYFLFFHWNYFFILIRFPIEELSNVVLLTCKNI